MLFQKGHIPWIKGKKIEYKKRNLSDGYTPWNKGLKGSQVSANKGKKLSEETRKKMSLNRKEGFVPWNKGSGVYSREKDKRCIIRMKIAGELSIKTIQLVYEDNIKKYGTLTCYLCELPVPFGKDQLEHKTPISRGGKNIYVNLEIACKKCNCKKGSKTFEEYKMVASLTNK